MRLKSVVPLTQIVVFALTVITQTGCSSHINMRVDDITGKVVLYAKQGQTLRWYPSNKDLKIEFALVPPCAPRKDNSCKINVKAGKYLYDCLDGTGCLDPEVDVGSDTRELNELNWPGLRNPDVPVTKQVALDCETNAIGIKPKRVAGSVGQGIQWLAVGTTGDPTFLSEWEITFEPNIYICEKPVDKDQPVCQIKSGSGSSNYTVTSKSCTKRTGTGTVMVR